MLDRDVLLGFLDEARGYLPRIVEALRRWAAEPEDDGPLTEAHRLMHNIKGAAAMVGLPPLSRMAEEAEGTLERATLLAPPNAEELVSSLELAVYRIGAYLDGVARDEAQGGEAPDAAPDAAAAPAAQELPHDLLETFREEAGEHLQELSRLLRRLEFDPSDRRVLQGVRRRLHTLKGAAGLVGMASVSELAHAMEDLLDGLFEGERQVAPELIALLLQGVDILEDLALGTGAATDSGTAAQALLPRFAAFRTAPRPEGGAEDSGLPLREVLEEEGEGVATALGDSLRVPLERIDELIRTLGELVVHRSVFEGHLARLEQEEEDLDASAGRLHRILPRLETDPNAGSFLATASGSGPEGFDPLEFDRYGEAYVLAQELAETTSDVAASREGIAASRGDFAAFLTRLERLTGELQGGLLRLRRVPFARLSSLLHRTVRTTAERQGKAVELVLEGEETELDKSALEGLTGPLVHLLRNAVDHGIEAPELRRERGKRERGRIRVRAAQEGSQIVVRVADDGAGIDPARIAAAARRSRFLDEDDDAPVLSPEEAFDLLFRPGFTTAESVSEISGRGVGLDVVRTEVRRLKGTVSVRSVPGESTEIALRLPSTLAMTRVLLVRAGGETVAVPLGAVVRVARVRAEEIERREKGDRLWSEGPPVAVVRLADALAPARPPGEPPPTQVALFLASGDDEVALLVDELRGSREVVVKPLGPLLRQVDGVMGATVLGDGSVVLILNPAEIGAWLRKGEAVPAEAELAEAKTLQAEAAFAASGREVLVVDDSLSVRRFLANALRGAGWTPIAARDGLEALEILQGAVRVPDAILLDIEMPRMDGYELAATLRGQAAYRRTPIVMLTSRAGEKHRRKAFEAGATEYLVKPYQEEALLHLLSRVVREGHGHAERA